MDHQKRFEMARVRSNKICFTWNNYDEHTLNKLEEELTRLEQSGMLVYAIMGREIGASGTPHIQGYVHLKKEHYPPKNCGLNFWKGMLPGGQQMHLENAKGSDKANNVYCSKDGPFREFGEIGSDKGKWGNIMDLINDGDEDTMKTDHPEEYIKFNFQISKLLKKNQEVKIDRTLTELRPWQQRVLDMLNHQNDRQILFVVDKDGGKGKSSLVTHIMSTVETTWACQGGKIADLMHTYTTNSTMAIFDMARCNHPDYYPWNFMENLKNGWFTATKYEGGMKTFYPPKIVVMMNEDPPRNKLSADRYQVLHI